MTEAGVISLAGVCISAVTTLIVARMNAKVNTVRQQNIEQSGKLVEVQAKVEKIGTDVDGKMEKLLIATGAVEKAKGVTEGIAQQKAEVKQDRADLKAEEREGIQNVRQDKVEDKKVLGGSDIQLENLRVTEEDKSKNTKDDTVL